MTTRSVSRSTAEKERLFALAYLEHGFNGKKAAEVIGYSPTSAAVYASNLLNSDNVQKILQGELIRLRDKKRITIEDIWEEWRRIGFSNMDDYTVCDDNGNTYIQLPHGNRALMAAVKGIETFETEDEDGKITRRVKLTLHDKNNAMDKLTRLAGMYEGKEAPTYITNNVNVDNRKQTMIVASTPADAAEEYRKLLGR